MSAKALKNKAQIEEEKQLDEFFAANRTDSEEDSANLHRTPCESNDGGMKLENSTDKLLR